METTNPLIGDSDIDTIQKVVEAMGALATLLSNHNSGLCMLMTPMLHALEHVADNRDATDGRIE